MNVAPPGYVIDTCSLTALRRVYPKDVFPGVWDKLDKMAESGLLISTEEVYEELKVQEDVVFQWAKNHSAIFMPLDEITQNEVKNILAKHPELIDLKKRKSSADPFLIACARVNACAVVTEEKTSGGSQRPKIPDVCRDEKIECISLLELFRREGLKL